VTNKHFCWTAIIVHVSFTSYPTSASSHNVKAAVCLVVACSLEWCYIRGF